MSEGGPSATMVRSFCRNSAGGLSRGDRGDDTARGTDTARTGERGTAGAGWCAALRYSGATLCSFKVAMRGSPRLGAGLDGVIAMSAASGDGAEAAACSEMAARALRAEDDAIAG